MKSIFFQIGKDPVPLQNFQHLLDGLYMTLAQIFNIDKNVIQINNNTDIKLFS